MRKSGGPKFQERSYGSCRNVTAESIVFLNLNEKNCRRKIEETKDDPPSNLPVYLPVNMFIMNENGDFDKNLSEAFLNVWGQYGLDFELPVSNGDRLKGFPLISNGFWLSARG